MEQQKENKCTNFRLMQDVGLSFDTVICQYIKLEYLLKLLKTKKYHVNRKTCFQDKLEHNIPLKYHFAIFPATCKQLTPEQKEKITERSDKIRKYEKESSSLLTSCWTELPTENILMWNRNGWKHQVCIKTTVGNFVNAFTNLKHGIWCGKMMYEHISKVLMSDDIIWYKEPYFSDEREVRFYFSNELNQILPDVPADKNFQRMPVDINTLIDEIVLSPYIDKEVAEMIKDYTYNTYKIKTSLSKIEII